MNANEFQKAKRWRKGCGFSVEKLAEQTGYSAESVYVFERGRMPNGQKIKPWAWQRYKMACAGVQSQIQSRRFDW